VRKSLTLSGDCSNVHTVDILPSADDKVRLAGAGHVEGRIIVVGTDDCRTALYQVCRSVIWVGLRIEGS